MKILVLSHLYPNSIHFTWGIFVSEQVKELAKKVDVKVVAPVPWVPRQTRWVKKKWSEYAKIPQREMIDGIEVYHPRYCLFPRKFLYHLSGFQYYWGVKNVVDEIHRNFKFDLIHAHVAIPDGFGAICLKERYQCPTIVTIHGADIFATIKQNEACRKAVVSVLEKSDKVIVVSSLLKNLIKEYLHLNNLSVINNGITLEKVYLCHSDLKKQYNDKKIILTVGNLIERKGHVYALNAIAKIVNLYPDIIYLIIGEGPQKKNLTQTISKLGLSNYVVFLGNLPHEKVLEYMSIANVFVLPSWAEAFGMVYIEAMAHAIPVIGCVSEGIEDIVTHGESGYLVPVKNSVHIESAIEKLLGDEAFAERLGNEGKKVVYDHFDLNKKSAQIYKLYSETINKVKKFKES